MKFLTQILVAILLMFSLNSFCQNFAPIGATWHYETGEANVYYISYGKWEVVSDTVILGKTLSKMDHSGWNASYITDTIMYVYEDSGVVYQYLESTNAFTTLYNFNANANDFWVMDLDTNCSITVVVDSTSTVNINGNMLKVLYATYDSLYPQTIIEKIGNIAEPLPDEAYPCYGIIMDGAYYRGLRCYSDTAIGFYNSFNQHQLFGAVLEEQCDTTIVGLSELSKANSNLSIYPNPTNSIITIDFITNNNFIKSEFTLFDLTGKAVFNKELNSTSTQIDVGKCPKGIYSYQIVNKNQNYSGKLVIQ